MGIYRKPRSTGSPLPPPPAPTARDANPWPMPEQYGDKLSSRKPVAPPATGIPKLGGPKSRLPQPPTTPQGVERLKPPSAAPTSPPPPLSPAPPQPLDRQSQGLSDRVRLLPWFLVAIVAFGAISAAQRAWRSGDYTEAIGPLLVLAIFAFSWWGRRKRGR
jgi:hypothetical protein